MNRKIATWVATGAVVLGIGVAGVGGVVQNSRAATNNNAPVAAAPATTTTPSSATMQGGGTMPGSATGTTTTPLQTAQSDESQGQKPPMGSAQNGAARNGGDNAGVTGASAGQGQGG